MKLDLWKSLKFSNRSGASIVMKTVIFKVGRGCKWLHPSHLSWTGRRYRFGRRRGKGRYTSPRNRFGNVILPRRHVSVGYGGFKRSAHSPEGGKVAFHDATLEVLLGPARRLRMEHCIFGGCLCAASEDLKVAFPDATLMLPYGG